MTEHREVVRSILIGQFSILEEVLRELGMEATHAKLLALKALTAALEAEPKAHFQREVSVKRRRRTPSRARTMEIPIRDGDSDEDLDGVSREDLDGNE